MTRSPATRILGPTLTALLLIAVGVGTYYLQPREPSANAAAPAPTTGPARVAPPIAQVTNAVRSLKLITWAFDTTLDARVVSDRWYGDATAEVRAPVRYQYGVDLGSLRVEDSFYDAASERYVFLVRPPQRLSCEIDLAQLEQTLTTSGLRWKSQNADQIDAARRTLAARAQALVLSDDDQKRLRDVSREQVENHLRGVISRVTGTDTNVSVRFSD